MIPATDPPARLFYGPDLLRDEGYSVLLVLLPAQRLMRRREMGMQALAGLAVQVRLRWPWGRRFQCFDGEINGWRWPVSVECRSDAGEIAARLAAAQGWPIYGRLG